MRMGQGGRGKKNKKMGFWNINANFLIKNSWMFYKSTIELHF